jgi:hypothetical protein
MYFMQTQHTKQASGGSSRAYKNICDNDSHSLSSAGQIELFYDRGNHHEFLTQLKELARHGDLIKNTSYPFEFPNVEKPYEVYTGSNVRLRYK